LESVENGIVEQVVFLRGAAMGTVGIGNEAVGRLCVRRRLEYGRSMRRAASTRLVLGGLVSVVLILASAGTPAGAGDRNHLPPLCDRTWKVPKRIPNADGYQLKDVAAVAAKDVWLVGGAPDGALALHWDGYDWKRFAVPTGGPGPHAVLDAVDAQGPDDVWAAGERHGAVLVVHWNGTRWQLADFPQMSAGYPFVSIAALPHHEVWVVGKHATLHRDHGAWRRLPSSKPSGSYALWSVSGTSSSDVWAVGHDEARDRGILEHWNGTEWQLHDVVPPSTTFLFGVGVQSRSNVLAVGEGYPWNVFRKDGPRWSRDIAPQPHGLDGYAEYLFDVAWDSPTKAWAVGTAEWGGITNSSYAYLERWNGRRWYVSWMSASARSYLTGVDSAGGMTWAVGGTQHGVIVERFC
jgi:hypothetical protein